MKLNDYLYFNNLTKKDFAELIGYARSYLVLISNGQKKPSRRMLKVIEHATNGDVTSKDF